MTELEALPRAVREIIKSFPEGAARDVANPTKDGDEWSLTVVHSSEFYSFNVPDNIKLALSIRFGTNENSPVEKLGSSEVVTQGQIGTLEGRRLDEDQTSTYLNYISGSIVFIETNAPVRVCVTQGHEFSARIVRGGAFISAKKGRIELAPTNGAAIDDLTSSSSIHIEHPCSIAARKNETVELIRFVGSSACVTLGKAGLVANSVVLNEPDKTTIELLSATKPNDESALTVNSAIVGGHWKVRSNVILKASAGVEDATFSGRGVLDIGRGSYSEGLTGNGHQMKLLARQGAVVSHLSGRWKIRSAREANLSGGREGFAIMGLAPSRRRRFRTDVFSGAVLTNFSLPRLETRRRVLASMTGAYHLTPNATRIPGGGSKYREFSLRTALRVLRRPRSVLTSAKRILMRELSVEVRKTLDRDAEFVSELSRLSHQHGAPGSVRTRIAWCAYRLQSLTARRRSERLLLLAYRCLGYGEKPAPAFLTWLCLALLSVPVIALFDGSSAFDPSWPGFLEYMRRGAESALGPLGALSGIGTAEATTWDYAVRTVVAIPLITGGLALRNYLKRPRG